MNFKRHALGIFLVLTSAALPALAVGRLADITVIDRNTGATLPVYTHRGEYWVAGTPGTRYAISVRSKLGQRLLAVAAVDGINVLNGQTAAWHQTGYVFHRYSTYQITGWRKSDSQVAAFEFSAVGDSYAGLTGRPANVGVIGVALFREKQQPVLELRSEADQNPESRMREKADSAAESRPAATLSQSSRNESRINDSSSTAKLGTAHGPRESSVVSSTAFERQSNQPDELVLIRYDSQANLIALGVIRAPQQHQQKQPPVPDAFPESRAAYVPDPPQRRY